MPNQATVEIGASWAPILTNDVSSAALDCIDALRRELVSPEFPRGQDASLGSGTAGLSLFYAFLAESLPELDAKSSRYAVDALVSSVDAMTTRTLHPRFYAGFTGIAWTLEHLQGRLIERDEDDPNGSIDEALSLFLEQSHWRGDYDLISGLVGYGTYALARPAGPARSALLAKVIAHLKAIAVATAEGFTWFTPPYLLPQWQQLRMPDGHYNLGLAHGVPGVITLLARASAEGIAPEGTRELLQGAVDSLLSAEIRSPGLEGFPTMLTVKGISEDRKQSRISWCYGDLGIAVSLLWAARCVGESAWEQEALRIATRAAERPLADAGVVDAGLCHGAAGNAHLFNRLYQATRDEVFLHAAQRYFQLALSLRKPGRGVAGFMAWAGANGGEWRNEPGLLEGAAGIGLALLAAVSSVEPDWDDMLLVSVPPVSSLQ